MGSKDPSSSLHEWEVGIILSHPPSPRSNLISLPFSQEVILQLLFSHIKIVNNFMVFCNMVISF